MSAKHAKNANGFRTVLSFASFASFADYTLPGSEPGLEITPAVAFTPPVNACNQQSEQQASQRNSGPKYEPVPGTIIGQLFIFFVIAVAAAEAAVGLSIIIAIFRNRHTVNVDRLNIMKW